MCVKKKKKRRKLQLALLNSFTFVLQQACVKPWRLSIPCVYIVSIVNNICLDSDIV